ncbi:AtpZ/AtpI family protein [Parasphingorhabdus sp. DH2-15]|jgi:ATP synthase protein I|uniref:AtpZ/AtpI family protein n=1 Tax=Parasphingorhabdus sp. DH2-15 TaxID=3444112 RepID=UPI003F684388
MSNSDDNPKADDPRLDSIDDRLDRLDAALQPKKSGGRVEADPNYRIGSRVLADLIAGVAGGLLFGWLFDRWLDTTPWLMLVFLFLGIIVAFKNILRLTSTTTGKPDKEDRG